MPITTTSIEFIVMLGDFSELHSPTSWDLTFDNDDAAQVVDLGRNGIEAAFAITGNGNCADGISLGPLWTPGDLFGIQLVKVGKGSAGAQGAARGGYIFPRRDLHDSIGVDNHGFNQFNTVFKRPSKIDNFQLIVGATCYQHFGGFPTPPVFQLYTADLHVR